MKIEEARSLVIMALKRGGWNQINTIVDMVGRIKAEIAGKKEQYVSSGRQYLQRGDETVIMEVIWGLIFQGVLVPGFDDSNWNLPFLRLTDYGRSCVEEESFLPHDPDGFLRQFSEEIPKADALIVEYLAESLQCFLRGLNRAAAVMLGGASEQAILLLCNSLGTGISNAARKRNYLTRLDKTTSIFRRFELFEKHFVPAKPNIPRDLTENIDSLLRGVFDLIRNSRNDAGHPSRDVLVDRDIVYTHLRLFVPYCKRVYGLIEWFSEHSI